MCHKCRYAIIDGTPVHINGSGDMDKETLAAIEQMVRVAKNYVWMKKKLKEDGQSKKR